MRALNKATAAADQYLNGKVIQMSAIVPGYASFIEQRTQLMDQTTDPALKAHFKAEIDLVNSWGVTGDKTDPGDITDGSPPSYSGFDGSDDSPDSGRGRPRARKPNGADPDLDGGVVNTHQSTLPSGMPAVFDLEVGGTGKTLRQLTEDAAEKTGTPAIILAGQMWQETKAGLWGTDPEFSARYGKPGGGSGSSDVLDSVVKTNTVNPGNGMSDSGIMQINPETFRAVVEGGNMGGGVTLSPHPELAGLDPNNVADALVISGTLMKEYHDFYAKQSYVNSDAEAWDYALRAYVGGPGSVVPGNPSARAAGGGDVTYVDKVHDHMEDFTNGVEPRWKA